MRKRFYSKINFQLALLFIAFLNAISANKKKTFNPRMRG